VTMDFQTRQHIGVDGRPGRRIVDMSRRVRPRISRPSYTGPFAVVRDTREGAAARQIRVMDGFVIAGTAAYYEWPGSGNPDYIVIPDNVTRYIAMAVGVDPFYAYFTADYRPEISAVASATSLLSLPVGISLAKVVTAGGNITSIQQHHYGNVYVMTKSQSFADGVTAFYETMRHYNLVMLFPNSTTTVIDGNTVVTSVFNSSVAAPELPEPPEEDNGGS